MKLIFLKDDYLFMHLKNIIFTTDKIRPMIFKKIILPTFIVFNALFVYSQNTPPFDLKPTPWADSVIKTLTIDQQISQLFMVAAYSNKGSDHVNKIVNLVENYNIGGVIFMQGGPGRQINFYNELLQKSNIPLLTSIDGEWGLPMRLDSSLTYPKEMTLGATQRPDLVEKMGFQIAEQCKRVGVYVNFAPVVDVNVNSENPIINSRSFGEDVNLVSVLGTAYMNGLQKGGVMANAKHFPGHGDTDTDSHKSLPVINHDRERLERVEIAPFSELINNGLSSVMVAHLSIPALGTKGNTAASLTKSIVTDILKDSLGFNGLIFTDALNMKGVSKYYEPGKVELEALKAGNDVLLFPENIPLAIKEIKTALVKGEISEERVRYSCYKILKAKEWLGVHKASIISTKKLDDDLNKQTYKSLLAELYEAAITEVKNDENILPLKSNETSKNVAIVIGGSTNSFFVKSLKNSGFKGSFHFISSKSSAANFTTLLNKIKDKKNIIIHLENTSNYLSRGYGLTDEMIAFIDDVASKHQLVFSYPGNPYGLNKFKNLDKTKALLIGYETNYYTHKFMAQMIMGVKFANGKLPVSNNWFNNVPYYKRKTVYAPLNIELNKFDEKYEKEIDSLVYDAISEHAIPGCQVLCIKDSSIVFHKNYGFTTYSQARPVNDSTVYDIASITKIVATTISIMKLDEENKINLSDTLGYWLPELVKGTDYASLRIDEMLAHNAGLASWIPFYTKTLINDIPDHSYYSINKEKEFDLQVTPKMYLDHRFYDTIYQTILSTSLYEKTYRYSDLGYYFLKIIIEKITKTTLDEYVYDNFYYPLGLKNTGYYPLHRTDVNRIAPSEIDNYFRMSLIQGTVHDQGAAMLGGVGGHAGVFSTATDLATIFYMILNNGNYNGTQYLSEKLILEYTSSKFPDNRRGIGFDKPTGDDMGPTYEFVSNSSYGHTGFTGTMAWVDPKIDMVYIFLSNRTYPTSKNKQLIKKNVRTNIQEVFYKAFE